MIRPSPIDKEKKDHHHSPSFPFPRMNRKLRPQPLSAFSTDTTIRSSTCDSEESLDSNPGSEGSVGGESREGIVERKESLDRIGDSFTSLLSTRRSRMTTTDSFSGEEGEEEAVPRAKVYLRALNGSTAFDNLVISPLTLSNPIDPPSPLSPFGNLALFDALSPLPTPRFVAETAEEVGVSALVMEKFEDEGGFPWFSVEESTERKSGESGGLQGRCKARGQFDIDTPPPSKPSSPSRSNPSRPSLSPNQLGLHYSIRSPPPQTLSSSVPARPSRPIQHISSFDSWNPLPTSSPPPTSSSTSSKPSTSPYSQPATTNRLRRSTQTLTSKLAKPLLNRGRSASLPTSTLTSTSDRANPSSTVREKRCKAIRRSLSCSKSRSKNSTRRPSQIQKSAISSPIPLPHPHEPTVSPSSRPGIEISRSPPTSSFTGYRFDSISFSPPSISTATRLDPLSTSCLPQHCEISIEAQQQPEKERERSEALELEIERLKKVIQILIYSDTS